MLPELEVTSSPTTWGGTFEKETMEEQLANKPGRIIRPGDFDEKVVTTLTGFVDLISALAWPSASFAIAILFRRELRMALSRLGQLKYGGMEMTFREELVQAETLAKSLPRTETSLQSASSPKIQLEIAGGEASELIGTLVGSETSTSTTMLAAAGSKVESRPHRNLEAYLRGCQGSPRLGILEAWDDLSRALVHASTMLKDRRAPAPPRVESAVRLLVERGWINSVEARLVEQLRRLAEAAERHEGPPLAIEDARRFVDLAVPFIDRIGRLS